MKNILGIDIGGTKMYCGKYNASTWELLEKVHIGTDCHHTQDDLLQEIFAILHSCKDKETIGIGISFAGMIDKKLGVIKRAPNLPVLDGINLRELVQNSCKIPTYIGNDASLFTYAEAQLGSAKGKSPVLGLTFGTGVGGGMVINGEIYEGYQGYSIEPGHIQVYNENIYEEFEVSFGLAGWNKYIEKQTKAPAPKYFQEAYTSWDKTTATLFIPRVKELARYFSNLILLFNPEIICIGGGVGIYLFPLLLPHIKEEIKDIFEKRDLPQKCDIVVSTLPNAGALGAALLSKPEI